MLSHFYSITLASRLDKAENSINDNEILIFFKKEEKLPADKKQLVKEFLGSFLFRDNIQRQLAV